MGGGGKAAHHQRGFDMLRPKAMKRTARELDAIVRLDYRAIKENVKMWKETWRFDGRKQLDDLSSAIEVGRRKGGGDN